MWAIPYISEEYLHIGLTKYLFVFSFQLTLSFEDLGKGEEVREIGTDTNNK